MSKNATLTKTATLRSSHRPKKISRSRSSRPDDTRMKQLLSLQDKLDIVLSRRLRRGEQVDFATVPASEEERALWTRMTDPRFEDILEAFVAQPGSNPESNLLWKKALRDCQASGAKLQREGV